MMSVARSLFRFHAMLAFAAAMCSVAAVHADSLPLVKQLGLPGIQTRILKAGNLVYLAAGSSGVHIVNGANPAAPTLLATLDTSGTAQGLAVAGNRLYVADGAAGLLVADVTNPAQPKRLGAYDTPGDAKSVVTSGTLAFVADGLHGLQIIDVSNPALPVKAGSYDRFNDPAVYPESMDDLTFYNGFLVLADGGKLRVLDISDPAHPALVGRRSVYDSSFQTAMASTHHLTQTGGRLFLRGVEANLANPGFPYLPASNFNSQASAAPCAAGSLLYQAQGSSGVVQVFDLSMPYEPALRGSGSTGYAANDLAVEGDTLFVAAGTGGLVVMQRQAGPVLRLLAPNRNSPQIERGKPYKVKWAAENLAGMLSIQMCASNPAVPPYWSMPNVPASQGAAGFDITIPTDYPYPGDDNHLVLEAADHSAVATSFQFPLYDAHTGATTPSVYFRGGLPLYGLGAHQNEVMFNGTTFDGGCGVATVELRADGGAWVTADRLGTVWQKPLALGGGAHKVEARATNYEGVVSPLKAYTIDGNPLDFTPPLLTLSQSLDLKVLSGTCVLDVRGTAADPGTEALGSPTGVNRVQMMFNGAAWADLNGTASWSGQVRLTRGLNTFAIRCNDLNGNYSNVETLSLLYNPPASHPVVSIATPAWNTLIASNQVAVSGTASGDVTGLDKVEVRVNGGTWSAAQGLATWSANLSLTPGINLIEARVTDQYNTVSQAAAVSVRCRPAASGVAVEAGTLGGAVRALAIKGTLALMSEGTRLLLLDVSNDKAIRLMSVINFTDGVNDAALSGNLLFVAAGAAGMFIYDISNPAAPVWRGGWNTGALVRAVTASGTWVAVASADSGGARLTLLDVSSPDKPKQLWAQPLSLGSSFSYYDGEAMSFKLSGTWLQLSGARTYLWVFDVSNPASPVLLGTPGVGAGRAFAFSGTTLFLKTHVFNAADPAKPVLTGDLPVTDPIQFELVGTRLHALNAAGQVQVVDVTNPAQPALVDTYQAGVPSSALVVSGTKDYIATSQGLRVIDNRVVTGPVLAKSLSALDARRARVSGSLAVIQDGVSMLRLYDISDPKNPVEKGAPYSTGAELVGDFAIAGDYVYVGLAGSKGFLILSLNGGARLGRVSSLATASNSRVDQIKVDGARAYLAGSPALRVVDCSDLAAPKLLGTYNQLNPRYSRIGVSGGKALLGCKTDEFWESTMQQLNVTDPAHIQTLTTTSFPVPVEDIVMSGKWCYTLHDGYNEYYNSLNIYDMTLWPKLTAPSVNGTSLSGYGKTLDVVGSRAYVAMDREVAILTLDNNGWAAVERRVLLPDVLIDSTAANDKALLVCGGWSGLKIYDLSYQFTGYLLGSYETIGVVTDMAVANNTAWVAGNGRLHAIDIRDPDQPVRRSSIDLPGAVGRMRIFGDRLYVPMSTSSYGVWIVKITDPAHPVVLGQIPVSHYQAYDVAQYAGITYVLETSLLEMFDCADPAHPRKLGEYSLSYTDGGLMNWVGSFLVLTPSDLALFMSIANPTQPGPSVNFGGADFRPYVFHKPGLEGIYGYPVRDLTVDGNYVILASPYFPACVVNCLDSETPKLAGKLPSDAVYTLTAASSSRVALAAPPSYGVSMSRLDLYRLEDDGKLAKLDARTAQPDLREMAFAGDTLCLANGTSGLRLLRVTIMPKTAVAGWQTYE